MTVNSPQEFTEENIAETMCNYKLIKCWNDDCPEGKYSKEFTAHLLARHKAQLASLLTKLEAKAPKDYICPSRTDNPGFYDDQVFTQSDMGEARDEQNRARRAAIAALRREHGL